MRPLFDSNILIHALNARESKSAALLQNWQELPISMVTWIEVMAGTRPETERGTRSFLSRFVICDVTQPVAEGAMEVRRRMRLKLPDAIIYATALATGRTLVTYNQRDFPPGTASVYIPV